MIESEEKLVKNLDDSQRYLFIALRGIDPDLLLKAWRIWKEAEEKLYQFKLTHCSPLIFGHK